MTCNRLGSRCEARDASEAERPASQGYAQRMRDSDSLELAVIVHSERLGEVDTTAYQLAPGRRLDHEGAVPDLLGPPLVGFGELANFDRHPRSLGHGEPPGCHRTRCSCED